MTDTTTDTGYTLRGPALLFCPGDRPERYAKAAAAADTVILDLEDAVGPDGKDAARAGVVAGLAELDPAAVVVRVNAPGTAWHDADVAALAGHPDVAVMLPMAARAADVAALAPRPVIALCETAAGVLAAPEIAAAPNCTGLMWGSEDLVADLGGRPGRAPGGGYRPAVEEARIRILYAARAAGVTPVDTVLVAIDDPDTLRTDSESAVGSGYAAKACIHPKQVTVVREAFLPTDDEVAEAREVLDAAREHTGGGVFRLHGRMIDAPVLAHAREVLRQAGAPV
ncbi:Hydroxymethylglutaryl-CoA lyase [Pseudonocardia sp. Ae168_Ps1]|uniref:HpcH/HpaI aldolase/citrate lyase family protein n=1 Tax=unclassified Pseudonocardia TaxID=2619320 RepID=UPI00094B223B|nr:MULTISPECIES: CoA ester lyase [unclassified Pseudonocardia]OLL76034.1 Hydroxymethylglutaryl-CoA lyase [Pseudonocardia sp. Ae150A_Ps1]OLL82033.1 Hydroxymethylglutaryl-CoA lyase [Pseudonocardia sp. Ae168_Ps1]OLL83854.1 Hydroxymethylglutaryl-CoA lyase [Pseudonocardia sp. Ae263_Ps1]OLL90105.1 Hydroxymethylglutaryl-CoA lyase [Pseudonocardia sp. Ae356_Ps1]